MLNGLQLLLFCSIMMAMTTTTIGTTQDNHWENRGDSR
jgi:hypothetical protein